MKDFFFGFEHPALLWCAPPAVLLLILLYLLHLRSKIRVVSAIFLWDRPESSPKSGSRFRFRPPPAIFYVELAVILLLLAALAAPFISTPETFPPLAVILDDSMSMQAKPSGGKSPLEAGAEHVRRRLKSLPDRRVLWILAGETPSLASDSSARTDFGAFWTARAGSADLAAAADLARRLARGCEILIVTDRKPAFELAPDTACFSAGAPLPNPAIVNARRAAGRILIEAANFSDAPLDAVLAMEPGGRRNSIRLEPRETGRFVLDASPGSARGAVTVRIENASGGNALAIDDEAVLESEDDSPVSCRIADSLPDAAKAALLRAMRNNPDFRLASAGETPDLDILPPGAESDAPVHLFWSAAQEEAQKPAGTSGAQAASDANDAPSALGPLSIENASPLTRGLPLDSIRWAVCADDLPGQTLLRSGDVPVVSARRNLNRDQEFFLNLDPARSNITYHPFWPVFFQNLAQTVRAERFGPAHFNLRSGEPVRIRLPRDAAPLKAVRPDGRTEEIRVANGQADFRPGLHGVWKLSSGDDGWEVSVMGLHAGESDLSGAEPFLHDSDRLTVTPFWMLRPLAWAFLALAAALLALHHILLARKGGRA